MKTVPAAKPKNLGESLAAISGPPEANEHFEREPSTQHDVSSVDAECIVEHPTNARRNYTKIEELAESIRQVGLIQPIVVREVDKRKYEIISGHRRFRAMKFLEWDQIPVEVRDATDVQALEAQLVENCQREGLHPMEEAGAYKRLQDASGYSVDQLAAKTGKSKSWVYSRLKLLDLDLKLQVKFSEGKLDASVAIPLARLDPKMQAKAYASIVEVNMGAREAIAWLHKDFTVSLKGAPFDRKDAMLLDGVPACHACPKRSGGIPGLFDDLDGAETCTDVPCFRKKVAATWQAKAEKFKKAGATVLSAVEGAKLYRFENLPFGSKYVEADKPSPDGKRRTWSELIGKLPDEKQPKLIVAPDRDMKAHRLYVEADALKALAETYKWAQAESSTASSSSGAASSDDEYRKRRELQDVRREVLEQALILMGGAARKQGPTLPLLRAMAIAVDHLGHQSSGTAMKAFNVEGKFETWVTQKADKDDLFGFVFAAVIGDTYYGTWEGFEPGFVSLAKQLEVDLDTLEREALERKGATAPVTKKGKST